MCVFVFLGFFYIFHINTKVCLCLSLSPLVFSSKSGGNSSSSVEDEVSASIRPLISSAGESIGQGEGAVHSCQLRAKLLESQQHRKNKTLKPSHVSA